MGEAYFRVKVLGGKWTMERKGVACGRHQGQVRAGTLAADWCVAHAMGSSSSYTIAKFGDVGAQALASSWCEMMLYYFELASGCVDGTHVSYHGFDPEGATARGPKGCDTRVVDSRGMEQG